MISPAQYERFCLPYVREMVREIHRLGHKAIVIYFGGVGDRLEQIAATGADGLSYEASMKGYVNDTAEIAARIGDRMTLFSNLDRSACWSRARRRTWRRKSRGKSGLGGPRAGSSSVRPARSRPAPRSAACGSSSRSRNR